MQEWKPKPLEEERRVLILELDICHQAGTRINFFHGLCSTLVCLFGVKNHAQMYGSVYKDSSQRGGGISRVNGHDKTVSRKDVARFKILSDWWTVWPKYNVDNTLIVDTEHFRHYFNLHRCCLIILEEMPDNYLVKTLSCQLHAWLWTPYQPRYADHICREVPLTSKSLPVYRKL